MPRLEAAGEIVTALRLPEAHGVVVLNGGTAAFGSEVEERVRRLLADGLNGWDTTIPSGVTVQLGLVSVPVGPATAPGAAGLPISNGTAYVALDDLAYGYGSPSACPPSTNPYVTQSPASSCLHWTFIDASIGRQIVETWPPAG